MWAHCAGAWFAVSWSDTAYPLPPRAGCKPSLKPAPSMFYQSWYTSVAVGVCDTDRVLATSEEKPLLAHRIQKVHPPLSVLKKLGLYPLDKVPDLVLNYLVFSSCFGCGYLTYLTWWPALPTGPVRAVSPGPPSLVFFWKSSQHFQVAQLWPVSSCPAQFSVTLKEWKADSLLCSWVTVLYPLAVREAREQDCWKCAFRGTLRALSVNKVSCKKALCCLKNAFTSRIWNRFRNYKYRMLY